MEVAWGGVWLLIRSADRLIWGCARSKRRIAKYDALFGAGFKHAQKEAAVSCFLLITASLVNSNRKVFCNTNPAAGSAISP